MTIKADGSIECHIKDLDAHIEALRITQRLPPRAKGERITTTTTKATKPRVAPNTKAVHGKHSNVMFMIMIAILILTISGSMGIGHAVHTPTFGFIR